MTHHLADLASALFMCTFGFSAIWGALDSDGRLSRGRVVFDISVALFMWWLAFSLMHYQPA